MRQLVGRSAINFDEHKTGGIIRLLQDVKTQDAGFEPAGAGVGLGCSLECFDRFRLHMDMDMDDKHAREIGQNRPKLKCELHVYGLAKAIRPR